MKSVPSDSGSSHTCLAFLSKLPPEDQTVCPILQDRITESVCGTISPIIDLKFGSYNCIQLQCEHSFNASAIFIHFLTNSMTCPVCRDGVDAKMNPTCLPEEIQTAFHDERDKIEARNINMQVEPTIIINLDESMINRDWMLLANISFQDQEHRTCHSTIIPSRLHVSPNQTVSDVAQGIELSFSEHSSFSNVGDYTVFHLQTNFSRHLRIATNRNQNNICFQKMVFLLHHPLLSFSFTSNSISRINAIGLLNGTPLDTSYPLEYENLRVGYILISNMHQETAPEYLSCQTPPTSRLCVVLRTEIMMQCIRTQIHDQLTRINELM